MTSRLISSAVASLLVARVCSLSVVSLSEQSRRASPYSAPRTAWGDPDIQGFWSCNDDVDTPFERSSELGGKAAFGDEELAAVLEERAKRNVERAPTIGGETGAGPTHWYEFWNAKSTRTSKVIDPPEIGAEALCRNPLRIAELDPVHLRIGEKPVQQDNRPALAHLAPGKLDAVRGREIAGGDFSHSCESSQSSR